MVVTGETGEDKLIMDVCIEWGRKRGNREEKGRGIYGGRRDGGGEDEAQREEESWGGKSEGESRD